ncbi:hypothetical protein ACWGB8_37690 [Kitasatospora sp. NPDC054939]
MTDRMTPGEPCAAPPDRRTAPDDPRDSRPSNAGTEPPGLRLVVGDRFAHDNAALNEQRPCLHPGSDGPCGLRTVRTAPPPRRGTKACAVRPGTDTSLPAEHHPVLQQIVSAAQCRDFALAVRQMEDLLVTLALQYGHHHRFTLRAAQVRADLAWLAGDSRFSAKLWMLIADGWARLDGPASPPARFGARQATASWWEVPDPEAAALGAPLLATLLAVAPDPTSNPVVRAVRYRISRIMAPPPPMARAHEPLPADPPPMGER